MKYVSGDAFSHFRAVFKADFKKGFVVPADTFDNVQGKFPIGFLIWSLNTKQNFSEILTDAYDKTGIMFSQKKFFSYEKSARITEWIKLYGVKNKTKVIGYTGNNGPDFQNNNYCHISSVQKMNKNGTLNNATKYAVSQSNLIPIAVYFAVRHCISATWLNDRDQFLFPKKDWENDTEFQNDCLAFTLFHGQNKISCKSEINHFIPFSEQEINARRKFDSNFMTQFIKGKLKASSNGTLLEAEKVRTTALEFSPEASAVFDSGRELWKYYHAQKDINVNASLYDIREFFQGRGEGGKMKNSSEDEKYLKLLADLRKKLMILAQKIEPKVYEHGFLKP
jgi:hypothetical protein